jgi:streptomycin 6-kinase
VKTASGIISQVMHNGHPAMRKNILHHEELNGVELLKWWNGEGAVKVYHHHGNVLLMEQAEGMQSLASMSTSGSDNEATKIICETAERLHINKGLLPPLIPLQTWFASLYSTAASSGGSYSESLIIADDLLNTQQNITVLHGDLHHHNILDGADRGWLAIDPKGLVGESTFDYTMLFCNPDDETALKPSRLAKQVQVVCTETGIDRIVLLKWIVAYTALSAAWMVEDGENEKTTLEINAIAFSELNK